MPSAQPSVEDIRQHNAQPPSDEEGSSTLANTVDSMRQLDPDIEEFMNNEIAKVAAGTYDDDHPGPDSPRRLGSAHHLLSGEAALPMLTYPQCHLLEHRAWSASFPAPGVAQESAHHEPGHASLDASE